MSSGEEEAGGSTGFAKPAAPSPRDEPVEDFYARIDDEVARVSGRNAARLTCRRGCSACCQDDLSVSAIEAERIREHHGALLEEARPHPVGACAFLDREGACRVYAHRPAVCRSQGLPLRVLFEDENEEIAERRDICELNLSGGPPIDQIPEEDCWLIGPFELALGQLEEERFGEAAPRVALRSLFAGSAGNDAGARD